MKMFKRIQKVFTLIELLVVIAIIGILSQLFWLRLTAPERNRETPAEWRT